MALNGIPVGFTDEYTYVGMTFVSDAMQPVRAQHYSGKEECTVDCRCDLQRRLVRGDAPALPGEGLFNARVDPRLTAGCEVALDGAMRLLAPLQKAQHAFLRHLDSRWSEPQRAEGILFF